MRLCWNSRTRDARNRDVSTNQLTGFGTGFDFTKWNLLQNFYIYSNSFSGAIPSSWFSSMTAIQFMCVRKPCPASSNADSAAATARTSTLTH